LNPVVYAHPDCLVTTFADMAINQELERSRKDKRHGSVGLGINETIERSQIPELKITMADVWNNSKSIEEKLKKICDNYARFRVGKPIPSPDKMIERFLEGLTALADKINPLGIAQCKDIVFEGAQGLLLDQNNKEFFPHLTRSNTGMQNVRFLMAQAGITEVETYYVSRSYLTKHGAGVLPGEDSKMKFEDNTNISHEFQGELRFAPLDYDSLVERCRKDFGSGGFKLAITHLDQCLCNRLSELKANGPTYKDVYA
jgi:adenylosuccinate synthase